MVEEEVVVMSNVQNQSSPHTVLADCKADVKEVMHAAKVVLGKESSQDKKDLYGI